MDENKTEEALARYTKQQIAIHILNNFLFVNLLHEIIKDKPEPLTYFEKFRDEILAKVTKTAREFDCEDEILKHAKAVFAPLEKYLNGSGDLDFWDDLVGDKEQ
jgi:hypothetical protein